MSCSTIRDDTEFLIDSIKETFNSLDMFYWGVSYEKLYADIICIA